MPSEVSRADERLEFAIQLAEKANDSYAWLVAVGARYSRAQQKMAAPEELAALRNSIWARVDPLRGRFRSRGARLWAGQVIEQTMGSLFRDELAAGDVSAARMFEMMETVKARTLLDQMHGEFRELPGAALAERAMDIERKLTWFAPDAAPDDVLSEIRLTSQLPIGSRFGPSPEQDLLRQVEERYSQADAGFSSVQPVCALNEIQQALEPREALLEYAIPYHPLHPAFRLYALLVTKADAFAVECDLSVLPSPGMIGKLTVDDKQPMDASPLGQLIVDTRTAIRRGEDSDAGERLQTLHGILIGPLLERGLDWKSLDRLVIVPHRMLHSVPWGALSGEDGRCLIQQIALAIAPSASIWHTLAMRAPLRLDSFLALANPHPLPDPNLPPLGQAEAEVNEIAKSLAALQPLVLKGPDATEDALRGQIAGKSLVHIATHGEFPIQDALDFHSLLLAPSAANDGRVRAEELRGMDFRSASLVVLSICNGGIYRFGPGDEPYGMTPALLAAGARNLLGTLWSIEDWAGRQLVVRFYANLLQYGPAEALRMAASAFFDKGWDLRQWASFVAVGTGRKLAP